MIFYPNNSTRQFNRPDPKAVKACQNCPVLNQCYLHALYKEDHGFWAGKTETERRALRKAAGIALEPTNPWDVRIAVCGTAGGYQRHSRRGEPACDLCKSIRNTLKNGYIQMRMPV